MLGGGMRQAGILAGACIWALDHHIDRLAQDHDNAAKLALGLSDIPGLGVNPDTVQTNMVFANIGEGIDDLADFLKEREIIIDRASNLRLVTHLDISSQDIDAVIKGFSDFYTP